MLGFTGGDNQGIIGLEVQYDVYLQGIEGTILTTTDARGIEVENTSEGRVEPIPGSDLYISLVIRSRAMSSRLQKESWNRMEAKSVSDYLNESEKRRNFAMTNESGIQSECALFNCLKMPKQTLYRMR